MLSYYNVDMLYYDILKFERYFNVFIKVFLNILKVFFIYLFIMCLSQQINVINIYHIRWSAKLILMLSCKNGHV